MYKDLKFPVLIVHRDIKADTVAMTGGVPGIIGIRRVLHQGLEEWRQQAIQVGAGRTGHLPGKKRHGVFKQIMCPERNELGIIGPIPLSEFSPESIRAKIEASPRKYAS